jgi:hypothetical protein
MQEHGGNEYMMISVREGLVLAGVLIWNIDILLEFRCLMHTMISDSCHLHALEFAPSNRVNLDKFIFNMRK